VQTRKTRFDFQCRRPRCFGRLEGALGLSVYLQQITFSFWLALFGLIVFRLFPFFAAFFAGIFNSRWRKLTLL
jgi:hypothetical protein